MDETTLDTLPCGTLTLRQSRRGYRACIDALLLAAHAAEEPVRRFLDVGSGSGVVAMSLVRWMPDASGIAVERQVPLASLCADNIERNGLRHAIETRNEDIRDLAPLEPGVDLVVMNPPYFHPADGRLSPDPERAAARHQLFGRLADLVASGARHLQHDGRMSMVYPSDKSDEAIHALATAGLKDVAIRHTRPRVGQPRSIALITARRHPTPLLRTRSELILHAEDQKYLPEVRAMLRCP